MTAAQATPLAAVATVATPRLVALYDTSELLTRGVRAMLDASRSWRAIDEDADRATCDVALFEVHDEQAARRSVVTRAFRATRRPVVLCPHPSPHLLSIAMAGGARGVVSPLVGPTSFAQALTRVAAGARAVALDPPDPVLPTVPEGVSLSAREQQVLALVGAGLANDEIASAAFLSPNTVKSYLRSAYRKIGASRRVDAVLWVHTQTWGVGRP